LVDYFGKFYLVIIGGNYCWVGGLIRRGQLRPVNFLVPRRVKKL